MRVPLPGLSLPPLPLKLAPALHGDLAAVELALVLDAGLLGLLAGRLAGVSPRKVVELPICVDGEHEIPDGEGYEVDQHPDDVGPSVGGEDDQDRGETEDQTEKDEGNDLNGPFDDGYDDCFIVSTCLRVQEESGENIPT
jgi:hypothetical protein